MNDVLKSIKITVYATDDYKYEIVYCPYTISLMCIEHTDTGTEDEKENLISFASLDELREVINALETVYNYGKNQEASK